MLRIVTSGCNRVTALPTMEARPKAPQAPGYPELARSARRDAPPGPDRNATAGPSNTLLPTPAPATNKPAAAPRPTSDNPVMPAGAKPATMGPLEAPTDPRGAPRGLTLAAIAASLVIAFAGWSLYRSEVANHVAMTIPPVPQASEDLAQVKQTLQQERDKAEQLARELATAWRELRSQGTALADKAAQDQELTDLRQALQHTERQSEAYQQFLAQERARNLALEEQLAARRDVPPLRGRNNATASLSDTLGPTRAPAIDKPATVPRPTSVKPVMPAVDKPATIAAWPTALEAVLPAAEEEPGNPTLAHSAHRDATPSRSRDATVSLLDTPDVTQAPATDIAGTTPLPSNGKPVMPAVDKLATIAARPTVPEAPGNPEALRLMARASLLLGQGNVGAARTVLDRAAETGSAAALFALAETYDPAILTAWGTVGTQGDAAKAQELYAKAFAGGVQEAGDRLNALRK